MPVFHILLYYTVLLLLEQRRVPSRRPRDDPHGRPRPRPCVSLPVCLSPRINKRATRGAASQHGSIQAAPCSSTAAVRQPDA